MSGNFLAERHGNVSVLTKFKGQAMLNHAVRDIMEHKETSLGK